MFQFMPSKCLDSLIMIADLSGLNFDQFVVEAAEQLSTNMEANLGLRMKYPTET